MGRESTVLRGGQATKPPCDSRNILLVEPSPAGASRTVQSLQEGRLAHSQVQGVEQALVRLSQERPSLVLFDPEAFEDPGAACARLKEALVAHEVPLVALVNENTHVELLEACYLAGNDDCILRKDLVSQLSLRLRNLGTPPEPRSPLRLASGQRVVLVGHEPAHLVHTATMLEHSGYHVVRTSVDAVSALAEAVAEPIPTLVLLFCDPGAAYEALRATVSKALGREGKHLVFLSAADALEASKRAEGGAGPRAWFGSARVDAQAIVSRVNTHFNRVTQDMRVHERMPFFCPVELREIGTGSTPWTTCYSYDLSPGGIFVRGTLPPRVRACVELRIHFTLSQEVLEGTGVVSWANSFSRRHVWSYPLGAGIQFLGMSPKRLSQLRALCSEVAQQMPGRGPGDP